MEPVVVKQYRKEYVFNLDRIIITRKNKPAREIYYHEIKEISYNPKYELIDFINGITGDIGARYYQRNAFNIDLNSGKWVCLKLSNDDLEKVKNIIPLSVKIV